MLTFLITLLIASAAIVETPNDPSPDPKGVFDYSCIEAQGHPRLYAHQEDFDLLRKKVGPQKHKNPVLYRIHEITMQQTDRLLEKPERIEYEFDASNKRLLPMFKKALRGIFHFAYAYKMTGDEKYLTAGRELLMKICHWKDWNDAHFLDTAEASIAVSIGYDWLYQDLSYEERALAEKCLKEYALDRATGWWRHVKTNWNQVCYDGMVAAAIVTYEKHREQSAALIEECVVNNKLAMEEIYAPDGAYPEGYMYWNFGTQHQMLLLTELKAVFGHTAGLEDSEGFDQTGRYMLYMSSINRKPYTYCDQVAGWYGQNAMWYFAARENDPSLLCNEFFILNNTGTYPDGGDSDRLQPIVPILIKDMKLKKMEAKMPSKQIWAGQGEAPVVLVHTGWNYDEGDHYLGVKGGRAVQSHGHMDAGSFVYDAYGVRWSDDLGREEYTHIETPIKKAGGDVWEMTQNSMRWEVYRYNNLAHSTLTVNRANHLIEGKGTLERVIETRDSLGGTFDLSAVLADQVSKAVRSVVLVGGEDLVITDYIEAKETIDANVQWRMLTTAAADIVADGEKLSKSGVSMLLKAESSDPTILPSYQVWPAARPSYWPERTWDTPNEGRCVAGYEVTIPAGKSVTLTTTLKRSE